MKPAECKTLAEVRENIDRLDNLIVELMAKRSQYVTQAARFKKDEGEVEDPARVEQVIENKIALAKKYGLSPFVAEKTYRAMIAAFIELEKRNFRGNCKLCVLPGPGEIL